MSKRETYLLILVCTNPNTVLARSATHTRTSFQELWIRLKSTENTLKLTRKFQVVVDDRKRDPRPNIALVVRPTRCHGNIGEAASELPVNLCWKVEKRVRKKKVPRICAV